MPRGCRRTDTGRIGSGQGGVEVGLAAVGDVPDSLLGCTAGRRDIRMRGSGHPLRMTGLRRRLHASFQPGSAFLRQPHGIGRGASRTDGSCPGRPSPCPGRRFACPGRLFACPGRPFPCPGRLLGQAESTASSTARGRLSSQVLAKQAVRLPVWRAMAQDWGAQASYPHR